MNLVTDGFHIVGNLLFDFPKLLFAYAAMQGHTIELHIYVHTE